MNTSIDTPIRAQYVTRELDKLTEWHGKPERLHVNSGPEFIAEVMVIWAERSDINLTLIEKGRPMQNCRCPRFANTAACTWPNTGDVYTAWSRLGGALARSCVHRGGIYSGVAVTTSSVPAVSGSVTFQCSW